jgi:hypothetical protein
VAAVGQKQAIFVLHKRSFLQRNGNPNIKAAHDGFLPQQKQWSQHNIALTQT